MSTTKTSRKPASLEYWLEFCKLFELSAYVNLDHLTFPKESAVTREVVRPEIYGEVVDRNCGGIYCESCRGICGPSPVQVERRCRHPPGYLRCAESAVENKVQCY